MPLHSVPRPPPPHFFFFDFPQGQEAQLATHLLTLPEGMCSTRLLSLLLTHNMTLLRAAVSHPNTQSQTQTPPHTTDAHSTVTENPPSR